MSVANGSLSFAINGLIFAHFLIATFVSFLINLLQTSHFKAFKALLGWFLKRGISVVHRSSLVDPPLQLAVPIKDDALSTLYKQTESKVGTKCLYLRRIRTHIELVGLHRFRFASVRTVCSSCTTCSQNSVGMRLK